jgi:hypothetical protein
MKNFKDFLNEEHDKIDNVDARFLEQNLEKLNQELDALTERPYRNAPIMLAQLRGVLERYAIQLPQSAQTEFLNLDAEMVYELTADYHLYVIYNTNSDGYVDGYAQVVNSEDLEDLIDSDLSDWAEEHPPMRRWIPPARKDDDSGNSNEY